MKPPSEAQLKLANDIGGLAHRMADTALQNSDRAQVERAVNAIHHALNDSATHADMLVAIGALISFNAHVFAADQDTPLSPHLSTTLIAAVVSIIAQHGVVAETTPMDLH